VGRRFAGQAGRIETMGQETPNLAFRAQLVIPEQRQLYDYWLERAGRRSMPDRSEIRPAHFPRLLPNISLVAYEPETQRCRIRLAGTRLRDIYDGETTGLYLDELDWGDIRDYWLAAYRHVFEEGKPAQGVVRGPRVQKEHLVQYWLKLPLSLEGRECGMVLCYDAFLPATDIAEHQAEIQAISA
jgi:hypothetical protein